MDGPRYELREFHDSDYAAVAAVLNANDPERPTSSETLRHLFETILTEADTRHLVAVDRPSGELVAIGSVFRMPFEAEPSRFWILGGVLEAHRRRGVGSLLYDKLVADARRRGAKSLISQLPEISADGRSFLANRGFEERRRQWRSSLEVASATTAQLPELVHALARDGIELTTVSREGPSDDLVLKRVYEMYTEAARDIPRDGTYRPLPFDQFRTFFFEGADALPDAWFLAKTGGRYVGVSQAAREPAQPDVLQQNFTGTLPEFRRKKIGLALKLMLIDYAKQNGYARIETTNDSLNVPMWTLNRGLGFQKLRETIQLEAPLAPASNGSPHP